MHALQEPCLPSSRSFDSPIRHFKGPHQLVLSNDHKITGLLLTASLSSKHWERGTPQIAGIVSCNYRSWRSGKRGCVLPGAIGNRTSQGDRPRHRREHKSPKTSRGNNERPLSPQGGGHSQEIVGGSRMV